MIVSTRVSGGLVAEIVRVAAARGQFNQRDSTREIARIVEPFIVTCGNFRSLLIATCRSLPSYVWGEVDYWTSAFIGAQQ